MVNFASIFALMLSSWASTVLLVAALPAGPVSMNESSLVDIEGKLENKLASAAHAFLGEITWYTGSKLADPACGGPTPKDDSYVVAVPYGSRINCWDWVTISYRGKSVRAQAVDRCATCALNGVDATKAVFRHLAPLHIGLLEGAHVRIHR